MCRAGRDFGRGARGITTLLYHAIARRREAHGGTQEGLAAQNLSAQTVGPRPRQDRRRGLLARPVRLGRGAEGVRADRLLPQAAGAERRADRAAGGAVLGG